MLQTKDSPVQEDMFQGYADVLTVSDLAKMLSVGRNTAYSIVSEGIIGSVKVKNQIRIPKKCVIEFLEGNIERASNR